VASIYSSVTELM